MTRNVGRRISSAKFATVLMRSGGQGLLNHRRQDKAGRPAAGAMRLKVCLHVVS
jgi:hypothetical protein